MPTVLQITDKPEQGGGIRRVVDQHRAMLDALGWGCRELRLGPVGARAEGDVIAVPIRLGLPVPGNASSVLAVRKAARAADVVQLHLGFSSLVPALVAAIADEAPLIAHLHDVSPFEGLGLPEFGPDPRPAADSLISRLQRLRLAPLRRAVWERICRDARAIVAPSRYLATLAKAAGAPADRVVVLPHAVPDVEDTPPRPSASGPIALYAGHLSTQKGAVLLLDAFARVTVSDAKLVIVGDGPEGDGLRRLADQSPRVSFLGQLSPADVARAMRKARVIVHPSLVPEGLGLVGIEAMQLGRPVVGFGLGGSADWLVRGVTGLVAAEPTAPALAASLNEILDDGALADRLGEAGRRLVMQKFSTDKVAGQLTALLRSVMRLPAGEA